MNEGTIGGAIRPQMRSLGIAASGLSAQRARLDTIAMNIANAETTSGPDGVPYRRRTVDLQEVPFAGALEGAQESEGLAAGGVRVAGVVEDMSEGKYVYNPGHPDADEKGYVRMPNVSIQDEMVSMMETRRLFEANASVFNAIKGMLRRATQL